MKQADRFPTMKQNALLWDAMVIKSKVNSNNWGNLANSKTHKKILFQSYICIHTIYSYINTVSKKIFS